MCPELSIINDQLWNVNESNTQSTDLYIKLSLTLSNSEDLKNEEEQQKFMEQYVQKQVENQKKQEILKGNKNAVIDESVF